VDFEDVIDTFDRDDKILALKRCPNFNINCFPYVIIRTRLGIWLYNIASNTRDCLDMI